MWYTMPDSSKHYPLTIARVKEILRLNAEGVKPDELEPVEVVSSKPKEVEPEFVDVVGQISLKSLERNSRKRTDRERANDRRGPQQGDNNRNPGVQQGSATNRRGGQPGQGRPPQERGERPAPNIVPPNAPAKQVNTNRTGQQNQQKRVQRPNDNQAQRPPQQRPNQLRPPRPPQDNRPPQNNRPPQQRPPQQPKPPRAGNENQPLAEGQE